MKFYVLLGACMAEEPGTMGLQENMPGSTRTPRWSTGTPTMWPACPTRTGVALMMDAADLGVSALLSRILAPLSR